jgi:hypothetical protein
MPRNGRCEYNDVQLPCEYLNIPLETSGWDTELYLNEKDDKDMDASVPNN